MGAFEKSAEGDSGRQNLDFPVMERPMSPEMEQEGERWDEIFSGSLPMLPTEERTRNDLSSTQKNARYRQQQRAFDYKTCLYLAGEYALLWQRRKAGLAGRVVLHAGGGDGTDLSHTQAALAEHLDLEIWDASFVSCMRVSDRLNRAFRHDATRSFGLVRGDIETICTNPDELDPSLYVLLYAGRLFQHFDSEKLKRTLFGIGRNLLRKHGLKARLVTTHPFQEDNNHISWGRSTAYCRNDFVGPLSEGAGRDITTVRSRKWRYYRQWYTAATWM